MNIIRSNADGDRYYISVAGDELPHREDGPAIDCKNGFQLWYRYGKLHREDGPALTYTDGYQEWWLNGKRLPCYNQKDFERLMRLKAFW